MIRALVLGGWVAITAFAFWRYDGRYRLPVAPVPVAKPSVGRQLRVAGAKATLLAFYSPGCSCSQFAMGDVANLAKTKNLAVRVIVEGDGEGPIGYKTLRDDGHLARALGVPAAPGAVVLDGEGHLAYVGGFNVARYCNDPQSAYAAQAVEAVLAGRKPLRAKSDFYGCALSQGKP